MSCVQLFGTLIPFFKWGVEMWRSFLNLNLIPPSHLYYTAYPALVTFIKKKQK